MAHPPSPVRMWPRTENRLRAYAPESYENPAPPADPQKGEEARAARGSQSPEALLESPACHFVARHNRPGRVRSHACDLPRW